MARPDSRVTLTDKSIKAMKPAPKGKREAHFDSLVPGLAVRVTDKGAKSFCVVTRFNNAQKWVTLGSFGQLALADARDLARDAILKAKRGEDPAPPPVEPPAPAPAPKTLAAVAEKFMELYVRDPERTLRSADEIERLFAIYIIPRLGKRPINSIRRSEIIGLLDDIKARKIMRDGERFGGPVIRDRVLAHLRKMFNWHAIRDDDFASPIVRGMAATKPKERARKRILSDDEIRILWPAWSASGPFGAFCKVALLTAQRREKVSTMERPHIDGEGKWTIPTERGEKNNPGSLILPPTVIEIIAAQPVIDGNPHVFPGRTTGSCLRGYSHLKAELEKLAPLPNWTIHDLRRTGKSLMRRFGVSADDSERVLGHVIPGVEGTYDRHDYEAEKAAALVKLAAGIEQILGRVPGRGVGESGADGPRARKVAP